MEIQNRHTNLLFTIYGEHAKNFYEATTGYSFGHYLQKKSSDGITPYGNYSYYYDADLLTQENMENQYIMNLFSCNGGSADFHCQFSMHKRTMSKAVKTALVGTGPSEWATYTFHPEKYIFINPPDQTGIIIRILQPLCNHNTIPSNTLVPGRHGTPCIDPPGETIALTIIKLRFSQNRPRYSCLEQEERLNKETFIGYTTPAREYENPNPIHQCLLPYDLLDGIYSPDE